jgi:FtsX-like permease family
VSTGVLAASVAERHREIGIRMALGADHASVARMLLQRSLPLTGSGIVLGLCAAAALTKVLAGLLVEVTPTDPGAFVAATVIVVAAGLVAALIPARKASHVVRSWRCERAEGRPDVNRVRRGTDDQGRVVVSLPTLKPREVVGDPEAMSCRAPAAFASCDGPIGDEARASVVASGSSTTIFRQMLRFGW